MNRADLEAFEQAITADYAENPSNLIFLVGQYIANGNFDHSALGHVKVAFLEAIEKYRRGEAWTLDEAFGVGTDRQSANKDYYQFLFQHGFEVFRKVEQARRDGYKTGRSGARESCFEKVAAEYSRSEAVIKKVYYEGKSKLS